MTKLPNPSTTRLTETKPAGRDHQVVTVEGGAGKYCNQPCPDCPWRLDAVGVFPPEAFRHSARTAYDLAESAFACHQAGTQSPRMCAGFLLRGAQHNLNVRMKVIAGHRFDVTDGGHPLHEDYRAMAIANGVSPDDPVLRPCR